MSTPNSSAPLNLEQQHKSAKDLLRAAREGDAAALARIRGVRADAGTPSRPLQLADAQLAVARERGFESWPKLVAELEDRDVAAFRDAVDGADRARAEQLLRMPHVRKRVNDPMFAFGQRATHIAAKSEPLLATLLEAGADVDLKSDWENGPYTVLDNADERTARFLLSNGATLTPNVAARLGWLDELRALVTPTPSLVHARGGDGQQPLHEAKSVAIADFLLDRGADIDTRCIDHHSTPAQYALVDRTDVCRRLLERGATPDIFMAACLGDVALATRLLDADPDCVAARVNEPGYALVPPLHIYCWTLGFGMSPHDVASKFGRGDVHQLLVARSPAPVRFVDAIERADESGGTGTSAGTAIAALDRCHVTFTAISPSGSSSSASPPPSSCSISGSIRRRLAWTEGARCTRRAGWEMSRWSSAFWREAAYRSTPGDPTHGSPPLGWAAFGSVQRRAHGADYVGVIDRLVASGADVTAAGNKFGRSLIQMAEGNPLVQAALRRHGAS